MSVANLTNNPLSLMFRSGNFVLIRMKFEVLTPAVKIIQCNRTELWGIRWLFIKISDYLSVLSD